eukprot:Plantae.Rhodophyta-Rhodochaete_pulchella.ctg27489.p1 GENE.Plantae.Rhodophyta-Rhodochaete_pulchella.ctg27489~~Plantae.Rhodophyta-Rhodochaete_pulchella.ctg27489.p1  ORF type:complete len:205 (-),score=22.88 Plantae.Rhodophyta-Rhodochaete_pulchella.ctg27489:229-843(-)
MLHSIKSEEEFYAKLGFRTQGPEFLEVGLPHVEMIFMKKFAKSRYESLQGCHTALYSNNIELACSFYSLFGFEPVLRFTTNGARAAWLDSPWVAMRIEIIEIPEYARSPTTPRGNPLEATPETGMRHISFDLTAVACSLGAFLDFVNEESVRRFRKTMRVLRAPDQAMMGRLVCETAFIADADGVPIEIIRRVAPLKHEMVDDW